MGVDVYVNVNDAIITEGTAAPATLARLPKVDLDCNFNSRSGVGTNKLWTKLRWLSLALEWWAWP